jgi:ADP-ribose pyrophosphatase YjhB (NUDIX family)
VTASTRPCAFVVLWAGDRVGLAEMTDAVEGVFHRPLGGGIEFGERAAEAARRELREELALELVSLTLLGVIENLFTFRDVPHHEICFVFETVLDPATLEALDGRAVPDTGSGSEIVRVHDVATLPAPLYPDGVSALIDGSAAR